MEKISSKDIPTNFEEAIKELEAIVQILEKGEASLEQSLELFKRGVTLTEFCNKKLCEAQGVVNVLSRSKDGELQEVPFDTSDIE
jgi:exodeoxyribonuclease VII small subunit